MNRQKRNYFLIKTAVSQGMVFRIILELFSLCWKFRNEKISIDELLNRS